VGAYTAPQAVRLDIMRKRKEKDGKHERRGKDETEKTEVQNEGRRRLPIAPNCNFTAKALAVSDLCDESRISFFPLIFQSISVFLLAAFLWALLPEIKWMMISIACNFVCTL